MEATMTRILAFLDESPCSAGVHRTATWLGRLIGATVEPIRVIDPSEQGRQHEEAPSDLGLVHGHTTDVLLRELSADDIAVGVIGSRSVDAKPQVVGHVALALLTQSSVPLVVAPPDTRPPPQNTPRFLVPLDGTEETTEALLPLATAFAAAGATVIIAHVFDASSVPPFIGSAEDLEVLASELNQQHLPGLAERCELRIGDPGVQIMDLVDSERPDAVIVAWHQDLSPGHADVMRRLLGEAKVPLVVVPISRTGA